MDQTTHVVDNLNPKNKGIQWQTSKSLQYSPHITELFFFWTAHGTVEFYIIVSACFVHSFFFHFSFSLHSQLAQGLWIAFICDCMAQLTRVSSKTICTLEHFKTGSIRSECNESLGL